MKEKRPKTDQGHRKPGAGGPGANKPAKTGKLPGPAHGAPFTTKHPLRFPTPNRRGR